MNWYRIISDNKDLPTKISRDCANAVIRLSKLTKEQALNPDYLDLWHVDILEKEFGPDWATKLNNISFKLQQII